MTLLLFLHNKCNLNLICGLLKASVFIKVQFRTKSDTIDVFTQGLVNAKNMKWELLKKQKKIDKQHHFNNKPSISTKYLIAQLDSKSKMCIDISNLRQLQLDSLLVSSVDANNLDDFYEIVCQIIEKKNLPSHNVTFDILEIISSDGNNEVLMKLISVIEKNDNQFYEENLKFELFNLNCMWTNCELKDTIQGIRNLYPQCLMDSKLERHILSLLKKILDDVISRKGEAILVQVRHLFEDISEQNDDYAPIYEFWKRCFESTWYSDRLLSNELIQKYKQIRKFLIIESNFIIYKYLIDHDTETVMRLIQLFLKFDMKKQTESSLKVLFDYQCWRKDLRAVSSIIKFCLDLDIPLTDKENRKFLTLLLNKQPATTKSSLTIPNYQYKF